jgi:hypothetical protein
MRPDGGHTVYERAPAQFGTDLFENRLFYADAYGPQAVAHARRSSRIDASFLTWCGVRAFRTSADGVTAIAFVRYPIVHPISGYVGMRNHVAASRDLLHRPSLPEVTNFCRDRGFSSRGGARGSLSWSKI